MKNAKRWMFITAVLFILVVANVNAVAPFKKVSIATGKTTSTTPSTNPDAVETVDGEAESEVTEEKSENTVGNGTSTKDSRLTGIPQIDYIWDPNLPRELRGYNLSSYPFLSTTPADDEIHFKCDGLHDGFYSSIEYKCQVYHHCVYGIRHDFLCANFTAFDQRTFICHFVSDVDCEGSQKYWNRNDDLYMATTTTSTTTTTTEPPPTIRKRPVRPSRPLRRPSNRRPVDDYYYEQEEYDDDDYYEERVKPIRKHRPIRRKPVVAEYEDDLEDEPRSFADENSRRGSGRDRIRDEVEPEDDYDTDRRSFEKPKTRSKTTAAVERRKQSNRKQNNFAARGSADERRSFSDDHPLTSRRKAVVPIEPVESPGLPRRSNGRRRINEKRSTTTSPASDLDDLDEYERPHAHMADQEEAAADEDVPPKIKTTPKPLGEFVTPKAAPSSVYARPRAPPRIARPVPVSAKGKFQYPVQRTATTSAPLTVSHSDEEEYYEEEDYEDIRNHRGHNKKRIKDDVADEEDEIPAPRRSVSGRKPTRTLRKPVTEKKIKIADEEDDYDTDNRYVRRGNNRKRTSLTGRTRTRAPVQDDVDFIDDDYEERPVKRPRPNTRKGPKKPRIPEPSEDIETEEVDSEIEQKSITKPRDGLVSSRRKTIPGIPNRSRSPTAQAVSIVNSDESDPDTAEDLDDAPATSNKNRLPISRPASVRVVKRPFLPSRGGSPYLPRGLQPVGIAHKPHDSHTTDSSIIEMLSTNPGIHLLEHGIPLLRDSGLRTTLPPRSAIPLSQSRPEPQPSSKATLDELYENDYDVTLNDALNPTLKPLSPHQSNHYHQNQHHENNNNNRPYQSIYSLPISSASSSSSPSSPTSSPSESFLYQNQSPSYTPSSSEHSSSFQSQSQPQLTQSRNYHQTEQKQEPPSKHQYQPNTQNRINNFNSDSYFSSTDIHRRTIISPPVPQATAGSDQRRTNANVDSKITPNYYDDYEY